MSGIWYRADTVWELLAPVGFGDEAALHKLVADAPQVLPLAGSPQLVVVGREVQLGSGYADLIAIETTGRPVVIEVKLARNSEARRAVVAQALAYAAFLHGLSYDEFEGEVLGKHLQLLGYRDLLAAAAAVDQQGSVDAERFTSAVARHLATGAFRIVFVLDDAPSDLVRLVGYLESVASEVLIDLITVSAYDVDGSSVILPQRVAPDLARRTARADADTGGNVTRERGELFDGSDVFEQTITAAPPPNRDDLQRVLDWARDLESRGFVKLSTFRGVGGARYTLLPRLKADDAGLVTLWNENGRASLQFWRSVFARRCPDLIPRIEELAGTPVRQGNNSSRITPELLEVLTEAYRRACD